MNCRNTSGLEVELDEAVVKSFAARVRGDVLRPSDAAYDDARSLWNGMIDRRPALIVRCLGVADVIACVTFAREHGMALSIKGGGHNIAGLAVCDGGLMLDMSLDARRVGRSRRTHGARAGGMPARRRRSRDAAARPGGVARLRLDDGSRRPHAGRRLRLPVAARRLDVRHRRVDGRRDGRRDARARERLARTRICSGHFAAAAATSAW